VIAHPECPETLLRHAEHIGSTSSLISFTEKYSGQEFIVLTEPGILHQMKKRSPGSIFYDVPGVSDLSPGCVNCNACPYMKLNTMEKLYRCMVNRGPVIELEEGLRQRALKPLKKMLEMSASIPVKQ
jgi:quinolinate synthase